MTDPDRSVRSWAESRLTLSFSPTWSKFNTQKYRPKQTPKKPHFVIYILIFSATIQTTYIRRRKTKKKWRRIGTCVPQTEAKKKKEEAQKAPDMMRKWLEKTRSWRSYRVIFDLQTLLLVKLGFAIYFFFDFLTNIFSISLSFTRDGERKSLQFCEEK